MTTQRLDLAAHDIHAYAATRNVRDVIGRREPWRKDDAHSIRIRKCVGFILGVEPLLHCFCANLFGVDARAVVRDHNDDVISLVTRDESDLTRARLALLLTVVRMLNAMIKRVSQKVHQRIADLVDDRAIEFGFLALDREVDVLVEFLGDVAHHAREAIEHLADGNHAHLHDDIL